MMRFAVTTRDRYWHSLALRPLAVAMACVGTAATAAEVRLNGQSVLRFADVREGAAAITKRDAYIEEMSPFDRQVRPRTDRDVTEQELLEFMASHVRPWEPAEIERLTPMLEALAKKIAPWKLNLPAEVLLVKTSGREESGAAYCRGPAIVLPQNMISGNPAALEKILPHELFHVLSSHNPQLRDALYAIIGFRPTNEVQLPPELARRKITNPDAPVIRHYITVTQDGRQLDLLPILISKSERYDPARGGGLFSYLEFKLLTLEGQAGNHVPALSNGQAMLLDPNRVSGFHEQIGRNTAYIIHPEEILADNFVFLLDGRINLATPRVVEAMGTVLQAAAQPK